MYLLSFRWNSTYDLLLSFKILQDPVVQTLLHVPNAPPELTRQEWTLLDKVVKVLKPFKDATEMLSRHDASISMAIPIVTLIIEDLAKENPREEHGVLTMKRALKTSMETRFDYIHSTTNYCIEENEHFIISTFLDSKFKDHFYRKPNTAEVAKTVVIDKLAQYLKEDMSQVSLGVI